MKKNSILKENHEFRRLYHRGVSTAGKRCDLLPQEQLGFNRLGLTVSAKLACAGEKPHQAFVS